MKVQVNLRKGSGKEGFRIVKRFFSKKEAKEFLVEYIKTNPGFKPTPEPEVFYNDKIKTQIWISKQFTPTGDYRYRNPNR